MNRLQKKCVIATAGLHLLLLVILCVGPAFFNSKPKVDNSPVIDVIPANLLDIALNSGVKGAQPPPPTPIVTPPPAPQPVAVPQQQQPTPPAPKIVQPTPVPQPTLAERLEKLFPPAPVNPAQAPAEIQPHSPKINLDVVTRSSTTPKTTTPAKQRDNSPAARNIAAELRNKLSSPTEVNTPGESSEARANYASVVKSIYDRAWTLPDSIANDENIIVSVTIANDGTVVSSNIVTPSGDAPADASVQRTLNRVRFVAPFPDGATEKERTYKIVFNPQVKSSE
jgi:TonB family protein